MSFNILLHDSLEQTTPTAIYLGLTWIAASLQVVDPVMLGGLNDISMLASKRSAVAVIVAADESAGRGGSRGALKSL